MRPDASALPDSWRVPLQAELDQSYFRELMAKLKKERRTATVFPPADEVYSAFHLTPFESVRVVIFGQDPYHREGQAHGLAFSVKPGVKPPPTLMNIFKELKADLGCAIPATGCLEPWARQGVLLLNACLTVRKGEPNSHARLGWEKFTDAVVRALSARREHLVFVLWGGSARKRAPLVDTSRHTLILGAHPSPLSAKAWFGSRPFSAINAALEAHGQKKIDWQLPL